MEWKHFMYHRNESARINMGISLIKILFKQDIDIYKFFSELLLLLFAGDISVELYRWLMYLAGVIIFTYNIIKCWKAIGLRE